LRCRRPACVRHPGVNEAQRRGGTMRIRIGQFFRSLCQVAAVFIVAPLFITACVTCDAQTANRSVRVWLIPAENAGPNDIAQGERIPQQLKALRKSLEGTGVRLLNVEPLLADRAIFWNPQFNVPNFQVVASQVKTLEALKKFAHDNDVE